ncbi:Arc family DNA-binding protein [Rhizobium sp. 21-4511-3d]
MVGKQPGRGSDQFPLRLPDGMRDRIKESAERNGRSMNAEIVAMLETAELAGGTLEAAGLRALLAEERKASVRAIELIDQQMEMIRSSQALTRRASVEVVQHAGIIISLCDILENLDEAPSQEVLDVVKRLRAGAELSKASHEGTNKPNAKEELRKVDAAIAKADELLKDDED